MTTTTLHPINVEDHGYHSCGENWGLCNEHRHFIGTYICECGERHIIGQCAAWPITEIDCDRCFRTISCELRFSDAKCNLR